MGPAGSMTIHHARLVHGSALNRSNRQRRLLLHEYTAADAWPLMGVANFDEFNGRMVLGEPTIEPRIVPAPVRMPLPPADHQGSIYENQRGTGRRFFETFEERPCRERLRRRFLLLGGAACLLPVRPRRPSSSRSAPAHGTIDFAIGNSKLFRTTGSFKDWQGTVQVDDADVPRSTVAVEGQHQQHPHARPQQTAMLKDADFFDVAKFPEMTYRLEHASSASARARSRSRARSPCAASRGRWRSTSR